MFRTFDEILESVHARFVANIALQTAYELDPELSFSEQFSAVSVESNMLYVTAMAIFDSEQIISDKADELSALIGAAYPFVNDWYKGKFLVFQLGDVVVFDDEAQDFAYAVIDESKQIIKHVAIRKREIGGVTKLQVFVTKEDKTSLTVDELAAFEVYAKKIAAAGTHFVFISQAPDQLEIHLLITYNPELLNGNGETLADAATPVVDSVTAYLNAIKYSGKFNRTRLIDTVQPATGVLDAVLEDVYMNAEISNNQSFESPSGFFEATSINVTYTPGNADDY